MEGTVITKKGIQLLAKVLASKNLLNITRAAVGTGKIQKGYDPSSMIGLVEYKMDAMISGCSASGDIAEITMQVSSEGIETGFIITEIGIFAEDPDDGEILYAYIDLSDDAQYIYPEGGEAIKFVEITLDIIIAEGTRVTAFINPSSMVRRQEFEETVKEINTHIKESQEEINDHVADKGNPHDVTKYQVGLGNVDDTADMDKPISMDQQAAIDAVRKMLNDAISNHAEDSDNPHRVTKEQVGLENVDNTSDANKPVSIAQQTALDALYEQLAAYTRQEIANLINGAPSNLDTLKEVSDAIAAHKTIMDALDAAIGKKASAAEFDSHTKDTTKHITPTERTNWNDANTKKHTHGNKSVLDGITSTLISGWSAKMEKTGDSANNTVTFSSGDATNPTGWADIGVVASGEKHSSLWRKFSLAVKNIRYLYNLLTSGALSTLLGTNLTANRAVVANGNGKLAAAGVTATELGYLAGVKSKVQDQLNELNTGLDDFIAKSTPIRAVAGDLFNTAYGNGWYYFADKSANTPETYGICFFLNINSWSFRLAIGTSKFAYTNVNIGQGFGTWLKL